MKKRKQRKTSTTQPVTILPDPTAQEPSTQAIIMRPSILDAAHQMRPLPSTAEARSTGGKGVSEVTLESVKMLFKRGRYSEVQMRAYSRLAPPPGSRQQRAIDAFMYRPNWFQRLWSKLR